MDQQLYLATMIAEALTGPMMVACQWNCEMVSRYVARNPEHHRGGQKNCNVPDHRPSDRQSMMKEGHCSHVVSTQFCNVAIYLIEGSRCPSMRSFFRDDDDNEGATYRPRSVSSLLIRLSAIVADLRMREGGLSESQVVTQIRLRCGLCTESTLEGR